MSRALEIVSDRNTAAIESSPMDVVSTRSILGLHATSFFLAELTGVIVPFLNDFLKTRGWRYDSIGVATALAGAGVLVTHTPAGILVDRLPYRRSMLAGASLILGLCYGMLPVVPTSWLWIAPLLLVAGIGKAFFKPLLGAMTLSLAGPRELNRLVGINQGFNHLGNIAAAVTAMGLVTWFGLSSVFYAVLAVSVMAAVSVCLIKSNEDSNCGFSDNNAGKTHDTQPVSLFELLSDRRVIVLSITAALFHFANAPVMPLVALCIKHLDGSHTQVAAVVLVAQAVMIPVALLAGRSCDSWGRKWTFAVGFLVLPLRIFLYSLVDTPAALVALQALDGIGAGIFGVVNVAMCADLGREKGRFNTLMGVVATTSSVGGLIGTFVSGFMVQQLDFAATFQIFAGIALFGAIAFISFMPETQAALPEPELQTANA